MIGKCFRRTCPGSRFPKKGFIPTFIFMSNLLFVRSEPPIHTNPCKSKPHHFPPVLGGGGGRWREDGQHVPRDGEQSCMDMCGFEPRPMQQKSKAFISKMVSHTSWAWPRPARPTWAHIEPMRTHIGPCGPVWAHLGPEVTSSIEFSWA